MRPTLKRYPAGVVVDAWAACVDVEAKSRESSPRDQRDERDSPYSDKSVTQIEIRRVGVYILPVYCTALPRILRASVPLRRIGRQIELPKPRPCPALLSVTDDLAKALKSVLSQPRIQYTNAHAYHASTNDGS